MTPDISITGQGFYSITGESAAGRKWLILWAGITDTDDTRNMRYLADWAIRDGLVVTLNGSLLGPSAADAVTASHEAARQSARDAK